MKNHTLLLLLLPLFALQCKKDKNKNACPDGDKACELAKLPPLTTEGKGTFGCLVNGKAWLPQEVDLIPKLTSIYYDEEQAYFLGAKDNDNDNESTSVAFNVVKFKLLTQKYALETYKVDTLSESIYSYCWNNDGCNEVKYYTNDKYSGLLDIQFVDSAKQIISCTFNFNAQASNGETVCVTDGRFDMWFEVQ
jgi:hypothetical protein